MLSYVWLKLAFLFDPVQKFFNGNFWKVFIKRFGKFEGKKVYDIACGTGVLRKYINPKKYLGVDINSSYINYAKNSREFSSSEFILADATKYKIKEKYDVAFLISAAHHLSDEQLEDLCKTFKSSQIKKFIIIDGIPTGIFSGILKFLDDKLGGGSFFKDEEKIAKIIGKFFKIKEKGKFEASLFYEYPFVIAESQWQK